MQRRIALLPAPVTGNGEVAVDGGCYICRQSATRRRVARPIRGIAVALRQFFVGEAVAAILRGLIGETFACRRPCGIVIGAGGGPTSLVAAFRGDLVRSPAPLLLLLFGDRACDIDALPTIGVKRFRQVLLVLLRVARWQIDGVVIADAGRSEQQSRDQAKLEENVELRRQAESPRLSPQEYR